MDIERRQRMRCKGELDDNLDPTPAGVFGESLQPTVMRSDGLVRVRIRTRPLVWIDLVSTTGLVERKMAETRSSKDERVLKQKARIEIIRRGFGR